MATPAMSALIRRRSLYGGLIMSASHNPGGPGEGGCLHEALCAAACCGCRCQCTFVLAGGAPGAADAAAMLASR